MGRGAGRQGERERGTGRETQVLGLMGRYQEKLAEILVHGPLALRLPPGRPVLRCSLPTLDTATHTPRTSQDTARGRRVWGGHFVCAQCGTDQFPSHLDTERDPNSYGTQQT